MAFRETDIFLLGSVVGKGPPGLNSRMLGFIETIQGRSSN